MHHGPYPSDLLLHLESFVRLVGHVKRGKQGAFEHAARDLKIDRSVLRRRIQTLGDWLGTAVLEGRGLDLRPTAAGARLADRGARLLATASDLREEVVDTSERVVIACTGTITTELLPAVLVDLEKRPRPVKLVVRRAGGALCESMVRSGEVDIGVVRADAPPKGLMSKKLANDRLWFVMPKNHPLAAIKKPSLAEIASIPLILYAEASRTRARVMDKLTPLGATIRVEVDGRSSALAYVRAGVGATFLSLLPDHDIEERRVRAVDVTALFDRSSFYIIGRKDRWIGAALDVVSTLA